MVIHAANVTVVMSAPTTKWVSDAFFNIALFVPLLLLLLLLLLPLL
jgi:hypothetical protein